MAKYVKHFNTQKTPQSDPIPGSNQVQNSAGGYSFAVDDWTRLQRFLILGSEGGSYYASEHKLTVENAKAVLRCAEADGKRAVDTIVGISEAGRAPKNTPAIFALALVAGMGDSSSRTYALDNLPKVCRIGTHLFQFAEALQGFRGWGRGFRRAIANWYSMPADKLAYQAIKYPQRQGWSHRDLLRLSHAKAPSVAHNIIYKWIVDGLEVTNSVPNEEQFAHLGEHAPLIEGQEKLRYATTVEEVVRLIEAYKLPREAIENASTEWLKSSEVWAALLDGMPMEAMTRNLGVMTNRGLLKPLSDASNYVAEQFLNQERITKSRLHPIKILTAMLTYQGGESRGGVQWEPVQKIVDALDRAFYLAFNNAESTGKRIMLALDVSGSMAGGTVAGVENLTPRVAAAAIALVTAAREPNHVITAFCHQMVPLNISPRQRLDDVLKITDGLGYGGTDCALPMLYAEENKLEIDAFVVLTDSETWFGETHPTQALQEYRRTTGIPSKLIVVGMVANNFTIADPNDSGMLDVVGFDTATPNLISQFITENVLQQD